MLYRSQDSKSVVNQQLGGRNQAAALNKFKADGSFMANVARETQPPEPPGKLFGKTYPIPLQASYQGSETPIDGKHTNLSHLGKHFALSSKKPEEAHTIHLICLKPLNHLRTL